jgi:hypothetical protein
MGVQCVWMQHIQLFYILLQNEKSKHVCEYNYVMEHPLNLWTSIVWWHQQDDTWQILDCVSVIRNRVQMIAFKHFHSVCLCVCMRVCVRANSFSGHAMTNMSVWKPQFSHRPFGLGFAVEMSTGPDFFLSTKTFCVSIISTVVPFSFIYHWFYVNITIDSIVKWNT